MAGSALAHARTCRARGLRRRPGARPHSALRSHGAQAAKGSTVSGRMPESQWYARPGRGRPQSSQPGRLLGRNADCAARWCPRALLQTASNRRLPRKLLAAAKQCLFSGQGPTPRHAPSVPRPPGVHATPLPLSGGQPRPSGRALHGCSCAQLAARPQPLSSVCHGGGAVAAGRQASRGGCGPIPSHVILGRPHEQGGGLPGGPAGQEVWCVPSERPLRLRPAPPSLRAQPPRPSLS